jgi:hypothetical protein
MGPIFVRHVRPDAAIWFSTRRWGGFLLALIAVAVVLKIVTAMPLH